MSLKHIAWSPNDTAITALHSYKIVEDGEKFAVEKIRLFTQKKEDVTGFESIEHAKHWCFHDHYKPKMQPYLSKPTLQDAIQVLVDACHGASVKGGWWHDIHTGEPLQRNKLEMIALIHSEISEAVEGVRKGINDDHLPQYPMEDVEMADTLVRIFDYIGGHGLDVANALPDKLNYNANRADHKPENRLKDGGKKY